MARSILSLVLLPSLLSACAAEPSGGDAKLEGLAIPLIDPGSVEEVGVISFLAEPTTTFTLLDDQVGLDRRAARNIIDRRNGPDGVFETSDDDLFETVAEVDAIAYVGRVALSRLLEWARDGGFVTLAVEARDRAILGLVNDASTTFALLDVDVALDRRAARNIIDRREGPDGLFATVSALDAVPYVGTSALDKLASYGLANGYDGEPGGGLEPPCVVISEYIEGSGNNNKAVEIYNCGRGSVALERIGICLVRNDDTSCSRHSRVGTGTLQPGTVWTLCRTRGGTFNDPFATLAAACDFEIGSTAIFSGDDRLVLFDDADESGRFDEGEETLDNFGDPAIRPGTEVWSEIGLRRCNLSPYASNTDDFFVAYAGSDFSHLGVAPSNSCALSRLGAEGDDCLGSEYCEASLTCVGQPTDGSTANGKCVSAGFGSGAACDTSTPCPTGEICAGVTLWGAGDCVPGWMAGRYDGSGTGAIPEIPSNGLYSWAVVYGLASVPVDIEVRVQIEHPRLTDLRVTLIDPNGDSAILWDRTTELTEWSTSFVTTGISRDDQVNGRWTLRIQDLVTGERGTLRSFRLFVVSRFD